MRLQFAGIIKNFIKNSSRKTETNRLEMSPATPWAILKDRCSLGVFATNNKLTASAETVSYWLGGVTALQKLLYTLSAHT